MNRRISFLGFLALVLVAGASFAQSSQAPGSDVPKPGDQITLPPGSIVSVRVADAVNSDKNHSGDLLTGIVDPSVLIQNNVVIPRGTEAHIRVVEDKKGGHVKGKAQIRLELVSLTLNGRQLGVDTQDYEKSKGALKGKLENGTKSAGEGSVDSAVAAGPGGAVVGGVIGIFTAPKIELPANSRVDFKLAEPFTFARPPVAPPGS
jgi:hypothetical protein